LTNRFLIPLFLPDLCVSRIASFERGLHQAADIHFLCALPSHISSPELIPRGDTLTGGRTQKRTSKNGLSVVSAVKNGQQHKDGEVNLLLRAHHRETK